MLEKKIIITKEDRYKKRVMRKQKAYKRREKKILKI
jgi:hypothetical protein